MVDANKLKGRIVENGMNVGKLSQKIDMDRTSFYRKLSKGGETFTVGEVKAIAKELHLTADDINSIFFDQNVALNANSTIE